MGGAMEFLCSPTTMAPLLVRSLVSSLFVFFHNSLLVFSRNHYLLRFLRSLLTSSFLFFLRILPSLNPSSKPSKDDVAFVPSPYSVISGGSGLSRSLSQLLSIVTEIPVGSRKYDVVRSLAEKIIDDNEKEGFPALHEVNRAVLSEAFARTLSQLEIAVSAEVDMRSDGVACGWTGLVEFRLGRAIRAVHGLVGQGSRVAVSAEKLAAELLWLGQKMAACGHVEGAVWSWASKADLAWLAVSAQPRLQCSLVKLSAFLLKQGKEITVTKLEFGNETNNVKRCSQMKTQMLQSWLPLLCHASNGTDAPVLSSGERAELERVVEEMIEMLEEEDQEKVLTLWLHHFTRCSSSDWPDLRASYARWCGAARTKLLLGH